MTDDGRQAINEMNPIQFITDIKAKYAAWKKGIADVQGVGDFDEAMRESYLMRQMEYDEAVASAREEIEKFILDMEPYDFQELVAELLRAMGYYVRFVAKPGGDGGRDIIAYRDRLGAHPPRVIAQVRHRKDKVPREEISSLKGILKHDEIGLFVCTGVLPPSRRVLRNSQNLT